MTRGPASALKARSLRRRSTDAERRFWLMLRDRRLRGWKFRRQVPLGPYVVDFYCALAKVVVELDGGQHADQIARDHQRSNWLMSEGYSVVRFWNNDVLANTDGVLIELLRHLQASGPLTLPLSREGRGNAVTSSLCSGTTVEQGEKDRLYSADVMRDDAALSLTNAQNPTNTKEASNSVPSPLAGEGQGEGALDDATETGQEIAR
ncbi:MAG TPA: endonuclease domain-containing protein [Terriglobia bacterium]|nr:endonuclease domain-containing protein [Terriglobia bacterium]